MIELHEILTHWDTDDGITYHDPTDEDTWYNFATEIYHPTARIPDDELYHEGRTKEESSNHIGSGRYPKGSGEDPFQHSQNEFYKTYRRLKKSGMAEKDVADYFGMSIRDLRSAVTIHNTEKIAKEEKLVQELYKQGYSMDEIIKKTGLEPRTAYNRLHPKNSGKKEKMDAIVNRLENEMERKKYLDVGEGVEGNLGVPATKFQAAVKKMTDTGDYVVLNNFKVQQPTNPGKFTTMKILAPVGTTYADLVNNMSEIKSVDDYYPSEKDKGKTGAGIHDPERIKLDRVYIRYPDETPSGKDRDGTIELRRGVEDLSLGTSQYAQVRIATENNLFLKGVAVYRNDIPEGYDIVFNTNKERGTPIEKVLKPMKENKDGTINKDNPFGATISAQKGALNIVNEEGDWNEWSRSLSSQFLSKQPQKIVERQLDLAYQERVDEFNTILSIPNPVVRKVLLAEFADTCDGASVDLKGAAIPGQSNRLILPVTSLKENEVYAPQYENGTKVVLVRHPHAGTFELPRLVVNNKNKEGQELIGNSADAIGIHPKAAHQLSGADFDGDTVVVLPENKNIKFTTRPYLKGLENFETDDYKNSPDVTPVEKQKGWDKQMQMGKISNLITDMTLMGAPEDELERAVKHSMVIIDAEKHNLNWQKSYEDNNIAELKKFYQGGANKGASTIISRAGGEADIPERAQVYLEKDIDRETGKINYRYTNREIIKKVIDPVTGEKSYEHTGKLATEKTNKMEKVYLEGGNAYDLSSGHPVEVLYARYADNLRTLANQARLEYLAAKDATPPRDPEATKLYASEVEALDGKLMAARKNSPRERQAAILANIMIKAQIDNDPGLTDRDRKEELKRVKAQRMTGARLMVNAKKRKVDFSPEEWEAVEANAISPTKLERLLNNADMDKVKKLAMPKETLVLSDAKIGLIKSMSASGYTMDEIADKLNISASSVNRALHPKKEK